MYPRILGVKQYKLKYLISRFKHPNLRVYRLQEKTPVLLRNLKTSKRCKDMIHNSKVCWKKKKRKRNHFQQVKKNEVLKAEQAQDYINSLTHQLLIIDQADMSHNLIMMSLWRPKIN